MADSMTPRQRQVTEVRNSDVLVAAAAGSGKTWVLIQRIMKLVTEDRADVDQILMVTFTRAAALEMKTRLSRSLEEALDQALSHENSDPSLVEHLKRQQSLIYQAHICTIDSFCGDVLRDNFYELDSEHRVDPGYRIVDPQEIYDLKRNVLDQVLEDYYRGSEKGFIHFVDSNATGSDDSRIEEIVFGLYDFENTHPDPDAFRNLVSANAGELKTWVAIMVRDAFLKVSEAADMCQSTGRYMDRFDWLRDRAGSSSMRDDNLYTYGELIDFEYKEIAAARDLLQGCLAELESDEEPDDSRVKDIYNTVRTALGERDPKEGGPGMRLGIKYSFRTRKADEGQPMGDEEHSGYPAHRIVKFMRDRYHALIKNVREEFRLSGEEIEEIQSQCGRDVEVLMNVTADFAQEYEREKRAGGILEFSDVEQLANMILHETDESGKLTSTPSRAALDIREGFLEVLVDEYQDSNDLQESILSSVAPHMIMVGDMKQSIYGFRQARPELFIEKYLHYPEYTGSDEENVKIILDRNFRSNAQVLSGVNLIFSRIMHRSVGNVEYDKNQSLVCGSDYPEDNIRKDGGLYDNATEVLTLHYTAPAESGDSGYDSESSDSSDPDDSADEDTDRAVMEAGMVGRRIRDMITGPIPMLIMDSSASGSPKEKLRPARYSDIAILMRGLSDALAYAETLRNMGIPVHINKAGVLFETPEVMEIISFLKILDHSRDDISFAAVLKGFFGGMTSGDLAFIGDVTAKNCAGFGDYLYPDFSERPESEMYDTPDSCFKSQSLFFRTKSLSGRLEEDMNYRSELKSRYGQAGVDIDAVTENLERLYTLYDRLAAMKRDTTVSDIISELINDGESRGRDYGSYVKRLPAGENRYANLELFISFAQNYEKNQYKGIFSFLRYTDSQKDNPDAQQAVPQIGSSDAVNIYTIHKSKGLEYPVVIVSGCDKSINDADSRSSFILNPVHGVSCKAVFPEKRMSRDSIQKQAMALEQKRDTRGEELRLLYVAMTRARDKLILAGCVKDPAPSSDPKKEARAMDKKYDRTASQVLAEEETKEAEQSVYFMYSELMKSRSYSDFLNLALDRLNAEKVVHIEPDSGHPEIDRITEYMKYDDYTGHNCVIRTVDCHSASHDPEDQPGDHNPGSEDTCENENQAVTGESQAGENSGESVQDLRINAGGYVYPYEVSARIRKKYSVSEIKEAAAEKKLISTDAGEIEAPEDTISAAADASPSDRSGFTGVQRGTIVHSFLEHMDFDALSSADDAVFMQSFKETADDIKSRFEVTDDDMRRMISVKKIRTFLSSEIGKEMTKTYRLGLLYREQPFTVGFDLGTIGHMLPTPVSRNDLKMTASDDRVIIQGVIDAWYINDQGQAVVVDYKTDYLDTDEAFINLYSAQLDLYAMTLEKLTDRKVAQEIIYSFHLGRAIRAGGTEHEPGRQQT